jgi:glycosyltransferase involved in cell wall biosynthesis
MTDGLSAILSPFTFLLRIQHCLWYAHAHNSLKLTFSSFFVDKIVSSTIGSCRLSINKKKVVYINQGVEESLFPFQEISDTNYSSFLYFGRLDPSKNIGALLEFITNIKLNSSEVSLDLYGQSSNEESAKYLSQMKIAHRELFECGSVVLFNPISRNEIYTLRSKYDLFINLYDGSLDKTLIEATMLGFPVMTWNLEYCRDFGTWSGTTPGKTLSFLLSEYWYVSNLDLQEIRRETKRRQLLAITLHSFSKWIDRLFIELVSHDF